MKGRAGLPDQLPSLAVCAVLAVLGSSGSARAQALTVGSPGPNQFHLTATAGERTNSNAFFEEGTPQGDYVSTFQLDLTARRQSPRTNWSLDYRPLLNHYLNFSELDSSSHALDAAANYTLTPRSRLALRELFSVSRDPVLVASPQTGDSPLLNNTFRRSRSSADIGFTRDMSRSISLVAGAQYGLNRFEDPNATDADAYAARLGLAGKVGRADTLTGTYSPGLLHLEPPVPVIPLPTPENLDPHVAQGQGATSHELGVGWNHGTEATWTSELFVGSSLVNQHVRDFFHSGRVEDRDSTGRLFTGRATLRRAFRKFELDGGYQRRLTADTGADVVTVGDSLYGSLTGGIGRRFTYGLALDYGTRKSVGSDIQGTDLDFEGTTLRGGYLFSDWCSLVAGASARQQRTHQPVSAEQSVKSYFLGVTFKVF